MIVEKMLRDIRVDVWMYVETSQMEATRNLWLSTLIVGDGRIDVGFIFVQRILAIFSRILSEKIQCIP